jgi:2-C-methyl-D-erythritol 4-phosphate cytidylyltransferase/2-C-methyl-D-erythritol 2,4-cyclodiphosphate synthase
VSGTIALILAAGSGDRLGSTVPKAFLPLGGRPMVAASLDAASASEAIDGIVLVVPAHPAAGFDLEGMLAAVRVRVPVQVVLGGPSRQRSVRAGLDALSDRTETVVVHDAARPFASTGLFDAVIDALRVEPSSTRPVGAIPVVASPDTVKRIRDGRVVETIPRADLVLSQTPQAFVAAALRDAHRRADRVGSEATDDAMLLEAAGYAVVTVAGEASNFKITTPDDLRRAEHVLAGRTEAPSPTAMVTSPDDMAAMMRVGFGFDTHPFDEDRILHLGGVRFDGSPGLAGHSDGDAVCHAVADALLGAVAADDVGHHFPDTDPAVAGISGRDLLGRTLELVEHRGYRAAGCDVTVIAERPAIDPRRDEIRRALATVLALAVDRVSVKATRPEGLGLTGSGIGCMALVTVVRDR